MIDKDRAKNYCNEDISLIENYEQAANDEKIWCCHHRKESIIPARKLIEIGEYWHRPASELIFLTRAEHQALHNSLRPGTMLGRKMAKSSKQKMSKAHVGRHWYNNGKIDVVAYECPEGFVPGRLNYSRYN